MLEIPGYNTGKQYHADRGTVLYRGQRVADERPVIIKTAAGEFPTLKDTLRLRNEYEITRSLNGLDGIVQPLILEKFGNGLALVLEDHGDVTLSSLVTEQAGDLSFFFRVAVPTASTLAAVHRQSVIHKDIRPDTILVHPTTGAIRLTNFGIASRFPRENQTVANPESLEGDLAYISPEQTGRMNRSIDFRSDFYSLGVLLYEILTGRRPFASDDPLELVHCHIAQRPVDPEETGAPRALARILLKLLAKTPEERYQSAVGLLADLEICARKYEIAGQLNAPDFIPGENDVPAMFQIPQKLYGRESEIQRLLAGFDRTTADGVPRFLLVGGYSGIGKSALVREIHRPLLERRGYFVAGKFDQTRRDVPCWAIVQALQELIRQILTEHAEQILRWKETMLQAVGPNGRVIIELIPELELIIGPQPLVEKLPPIESQNRFNTVFRFFIRALSRPEQPLAIFLDDLQWADLASLELIKLLLTDPEIQSLFVIGAYRSNEVDQSHPLTLTLSELKQAKVECEEIELEPLSESTIAEILRDTLYCDRAETIPLAKLVRAKTDGNPFFMGEFLKSLYAEDLISLDAAGRRWHWSLLRIRELDITENVVDFMTRRIQKLADDPKEMLKLCACLGNRFDIHTLSVVSGRSISKTAQELDPALREGLIIAVDETYKYLIGYDDYETPDAKQILRTVCKFSHDRVQQAAYSLLSAGERQNLHYRIGTRLLSGTEDVEEKLIDIVSHLNAGRNLATGIERRKLSKLNLRAGLKARDSTAYDAALRNFQTGIELLTNDAWINDYELALSLHEGLLEAAYLTGDEDLMNRTEALLKERVQVVTDLVKTYEIRMTYYTGRNQVQDAVDTGIEFLRRLGLRLPNHPGKFRVYRDFFLTRLTQGSRTIAGLANLPECEDPTHLAIQRICTMAVPPAIIVGSNWLHILPMISVRYSIRHGNSLDSPFCYAVYGFNQCSLLQQFERGFAFGALGAQLAEKSGNKSLLARTLTAHYYFAWHHKRHIRAGSERLLEAYKLSLESGDFEFVGWNTTFHTYSLLLTAHPLQEMREIFDRFIFVQQKYRNNSAVNFMQPGAQFVANLLGESDDPRLMEGEAFSETKMFPDLAANHPSGAFHASLLKNILYYLFENYKAAYVAARETSIFVRSVPAMPLEPLHYFYYSLTAFACCQNARGWRRMRLRHEARRYAKKINKYAFHCPENYLHKKLLLDAEASRLTGNFEHTLRLYEEAARHAHEQDYIQEAALIAERAGDFCYQSRIPALARGYLQQALYDYGRWGAVAKVQQLREKYHDLPEETESSIAGGTHPPPLREETSNVSPRVDLKQLVEASQAISSEIILDELIKKILVLVTHNASANRACLILHRPEEHRWTLRAAYDASGSRSEPEVLETESPDAIFTQWQDRSLEDGGAELLAISTVHHAIRTRKTLVLDRAAAAGDFRGDPYISRHQIASILCLPLINQGQIAGILYLENCDEENAFTAERTRLISLLSTQMAISIENAFSYENKRRVEELMELDRLKSELFANISHEFRTPLTLILSPINDLLLANSEQQNLLKLIQRSAHSMLRLVNNLLDLARAEAGGMQLNKKTIDMGSFVAEIADLFENPAAGRGVKIHIDVPLEPLHASVDPVVLERVLLNLLSNALKYTEHGEITVALRDSGKGRFSLCVSDSGKGIPPAILGSVFRRFFSDQHNPARSWVPGTGIGLAFAKEMVELHGGTLTVKSREGAGSEFTAELPVMLAGDYEFARDMVGGSPPRNANRYFREGLLIDLTNEPQSKIAQSDLPLMAGECILIVEDEPDLRDYLASLFSSAYIVETAENIVSAIDIVQHRRPGLVLCDIMLGGENDGYDFLRAIRDDPDARDTLVVMLTARDDADSRLAGLEYGADDYVTKPFHGDELVLRVRNLLNRRRRHERSMIQAREALYAGLHEHLGSYLTDLRVLAERMEVQDADSAVKDRILKYVNRASNSLSDSLQHGEDLNILGQDFIEGIRMILLRRYTQSKRALNLTGDEMARAAFRHFRGGAITGIYTAIQEIATNDIKYGTGPATWRFEADETHACVFITSATIYDATFITPEFRGKGTGTIRKRLGKLHGGYVDQIRDGIYTGRLEIPRDILLRSQSTFPIHANHDGEQ